MTELVTVIVPTWNEEAAIGECLDRVRRQTHSAMQVLVADGGSTDRTRAIVIDVMEVDPRVSLVDNCRRLQGAGLNEALKRAEGTIIVRLDARSFVEDDYLERCVAILSETDAAVVGGRMVPRPGTSATERAIAVANESWWGAGPARFHRDGEAGPSETVYLGAFSSEWLAKLGGWAEDVGVNEDYELNHRIRAAGGVVWFDPSLAIGYQPRRTYGALARQYFRYGRSKATVMRRHPGSVRLRQIIPAGIVPAGLLGLSGTPIARVGRLLLAGHLIAVFGFAARPKATIPVKLASAVAALTMHWSWSLGCWYGTVWPFPQAGQQ